MLILLQEESMVSNPKEAGKTAIEFVNLLRGMGVLSVSPCMDVQPPIMEAVQVAVREGFFSITMLGHLYDGLRTAILEYLNGETSQGYHADRINPRAVCYARNVSPEPFHYTASVQLIQVPQSGKVVAYSSVTRGPYSAFYERKHAEVAPGAPVKMNSGKANSALSQYSLAYHDVNRMRQPKAPKVQNRLMELGGQITVYGSSGEEVLSWGEIPDVNPGMKMLPSGEEILLWDLPKENEVKAASKKG